MKEEFKLDYNYHTHTKLCGHAGIFDMEEYIKQAIRSGIKELGFSCHVPVIEFEYQNIDERMHFSEVDSYISTLKELKQKYSKEINILIGFEAEYDYMQEEFLDRLREKVDYMVLGQHYVRGSIYDENYPLVYAKEVTRALETGIFDFIAHPDYFMLFKDELKTNEERDVFDKNALLAAQSICSKSKELQIPLEINLRGVEKGKAYPNIMLWNVASNIMCPVIIGVDAHDPSELLRAGENIRKFEERFIPLSKLNMIKYNPVTNRKLNGLNEVFERNKEEDYTYQSLMANSIITRVIKDNPQSDLKMLESSIIKVLEDKKGSLVNEYNQVIESLKGKWQRKEAKLIREKEKFFYLGRVKKGLEGSKITLEKQTQLMNQIIETTKVAFSIEGVNKDNLVDVIVKLIEISTTTSEKTKTKTSLRLNEILGISEISGIEKGSTLSKVNPAYGKVDKEESNAGHILRSLMVSLLTLCLGFIIGYISIKF